MNGCIKFWQEPPSLESKESAPRKDAGRQPFEVVSSQRPLTPNLRAYERVSRAIEAYDTEQVRVFGPVKVTHAGRAGKELQEVIDAARALAASPPAQAHEHETKRQWAADLAAKTTAIYVAKYMDDAISGLDPRGDLAYEYARMAGHFGNLALSAPPVARPTEPQ